MRSGFFLGILSLTQLLIGLVARTIYAGIFGTSREMDVFLLVMGVVTWFTGVVAVAANKALVPSFVEVRERFGEQNAWRMASTVINGLWLICLIFIVLGWVLANKVAVVLGAGLEPEARLLFAKLFRIAVPITAFNLIVSIFTAILFSYNDFVLPQALRLIGLITTIGSVVIFSSYIGIYSMAVGMLLDGIITCGVLTLRIHWKGFSYSPFCLNWNDKEVFRFIRVTLPLMGAAFFSRAQELVDRFFASFLTVGSISFLNYAYLLIHVPMTILTTAMQVVFPKFSRLAAYKKRVELRQDVESSLSFAVFMVIPAFVGLLCLAKPAIVTLFQHGKFNIISTENTWAALPFYFGPLIVGVPSGILALALYSLKETRIILWIGIWTFISNIIFNLIFIQWLDYIGIALSTSVVYLINAFLLIVALRRKIGDLNWGRILFSLFKTLISSLSMAVVVLVVAK